jgi:hypothetical protein
MYPSEHCTREAERCEHSAATALNTQLRNTFEALAHIWRELAASTHRIHIRDRLLVRLMEIGARAEAAAHT